MPVRISKGNERKQRRRLSRSYGEIEDHGLQIAVDIAIKRQGRVEDVEKEIHELVFEMTKLEVGDVEGTHTCRIK